MSKEHRIDSDFAMAPILRLDSLCIGQITNQLVAADVIRLMNTGNKLLRTRIAQVTRIFRGTFKPSGLIHPNAYLHCLTPFSNLLSLYLTTKHDLQRVYTPINWDILPPNINDLYFHFAGCVEDFFASFPNSKSSQLSKLQHLRLEEGDLRGAAPAQVPFDFKALPRHLRTLTIRTQRVIPYVQPSLEDLPMHLEVLVMDFRYHGSESRSFPHPWPSNNLRVLEINGVGAARRKWTIEMAKLPSSLEVFKLTGTASLASNPLTLPGSTISIEGIFQLPSLREFLVTTLPFPAAQLHDLPHLEKLDVTLDVGNTDQQAQDTFGENQAVCLRALICYHPAFETLTLPTNLDLYTNITALSASLNNVDPHMLLPNSITSFESHFLPSNYVPNCLTQLPTALLTYSGSFFQQAVGIVVASALPSSLTCLEVYFREYFWNVIVARCEDGSLPNLTKVLLEDVSHDLHVPKQLRTLDIREGHRSLLSVPVFYQSLRESNVESLKLSYYHFSGRRTGSDRDLALSAGYEFLFNSGLPRNLTRLSVTGPGAPDTVSNWPPLLTHLDYTEESPMKISFAKYGASFLSSLPSGMVSLEINLWEVDVTLDSLPLSCLPPALSHFTTSLRVGRPPSERPTVCEAYAAHINDLYKSSH